MQNLHLLRVTILALLALCLAAAPALAKSDQELAAASQNPVADMISLPMKNIFNFDRGSEDAFAYTFEMQPVYPVNLGKYNLINRVILPIHYQEPAYPGMDYKTGLGDTIYQAFFSPADAGPLICGAGPAFILPTHSENQLGNDKWAAGPAAVALTIRGPWVMGFLGQHFWDFAGDSDAANVNVSSLQYFINYNTPDYYLNTSPTMSYNWDADSDEACERWGHERWGQRDGVRSLKLIIHI